MRLFHKSYSICQECGVHFEPIGGRHSDLCKTHRDPVIALEARKELVKRWAEMNWERLEEQALKEINEKEALAQQALREMYQNSMNSGQAQMGGTGSHLFRNLF